MKQIVLTILMLAATLGVYSKSFKFGYKGVEFKCIVMNGDSVRISWFTRHARNVIVPSHVFYDGIDYKVVSIGVYGDFSNYSVETLILEEGIEDIWAMAFLTCKKLHEVTLPSTIKHIGKDAFRYYQELSFTLPAGIDEASLRKGYELWIKDVQADQRQMANSAKKGGQPAGIQQNNASANNTVQPKKQETIVPSDVDINIPAIRSSKNKDTYCIIIANEQYKDVPNVDYALHDGQVFKDYCLKTLNVPEEQIRMFGNASYTDMKRAVNWLQGIASVTEGEAKLIFYYAGHGIPSDKDQTAYMVPVDGFPQDVSTCYKLKDLYDILGKANVQCATVILDACFSGMNRGSDLALVSSRGVAIAPRNETLSGNVIVMSATSADQTAMSYKAKQHGLFTYYLLKELQNTKGNVSLGDLFHAISSDVKKSSFLQNDKLQTPSVITSSSMRDKWKALRF